MSSAHLTAEVAGITLHFHGQAHDPDYGQGDAEWSTAPLKNFIKPDGYTGLDNVDISVQLSDRIVPSEDARLVFSAQMEATDNNFETEWHLYSLPGGEEMIVQLLGSGNDIKAASIRFSAHKATLTLYPENKTKFSLIAYPLFNIFISRLLARRGGFLIHSSVVQDADGRGYLFTAVSGTGKSTIAHIFEGEGATLINDDMLAIRTSSGGLATAYALPMPYYAQEVRSTQLSGFFVISQSPTNILTRLSAAEGVARVFANVVQQPFDREATATTLGSAIAAISPAQVFSLGFKPDADVVSVVRQAMRK